MPLLNTADAIYLGATAADAIYLGATKVWPSGFDPASIAGLLLWLDSSQLGLADGASVESWPDLSSGKASTTIGVAPNRPVIRSGGPGGKPVVRFAPGNGFRWVPGGLAGEAGLNWTCTYVSRMWGATAGRVASAGYPPANFALGYHGGFEDKPYMEGWLQPDVSRAQTTDWHLYTGTEEGVIGLVKAWFYRDGVFLNGDHAVTGGWGDTTFNLNGYNPTGGEETCQCEVAEVLFYNRRLPDAERQQAEAYLREKWGLG